MNWRRLASIATSLPVRILVSVGLLAVVAASIDWDAVGHGLANASWGLFALATVTYFLAFLVAAARWTGLLHTARVGVPYRRALRAYLIGAFSNNLLPSGFGGDAVRAWVVAGTGKPLARSVISVIVDRISALVCLLALAWVAVLIEGGDVPGGIVLLLGITTALAALAGLVGLVISRRRGLGRFLPDAARPYTSEVAQVLRAYERNGRLIAEVIALGLLYQVAVLLGFWLISEALDLGLEPTTLAIVVPPVLMASLVPISLAGFGVREGAFVVLLGEFGVSAADATLLSLLAVTSVAIASLPGGVAIAVGGRPTSYEAPVGMGSPGS
jgi:glycosyltransferase 2 family protein